MTITLMLGQLADSAEALSRLAALKLKSRIALRVKRVLRAAQPELEEFNKARTPIAEQYGHKSADGLRYEFDTPESAQSFADEIADVRREEIMLEASTLALDELGEAEISGGDLLALDWLILEEDG